MRMALFKGNGALQQAVYAVEVGKPFIHRVGEFDKAMTRWERKAEAETKINTGNERETSIRFFNKFASLTFEIRKVAKDLVGVYSWEYVDNLAGIVETARKSMDALYNWKAPALTAGSVVLAAAWAISLLFDTPAKTVLFFAGSAGFGILRGAIAYYKYRLDKLWEPCGEAVKSWHGAYKLSEGHDPVDFMDSKERAHNLIKAARGHVAGDGQLKTPVLIEGKLVVDAAWTEVKLEPRR